MIPGSSANKGEDFDVGVLWTTPNAEEDVVRSSSTIRVKERIFNNAFQLLLATCDFVLILRYFVQASGVGITCSMIEVVVVLKKVEGGRCWVLTTN